ncbi:MAG: HEPN domain-containing protein [Chloroflexota bacterium]
MSDLKPSELVHIWLERAHSDLNLGRAALRARGILPEDACFHAQQCAEKAMKGLLTKHGIDFPRTHVIETLLDFLKANGVSVPNIVDEAFVLTQYAVQTRYPGEWEPVTKKEAQRALERAAQVLTWVEEQIILGGQYL